jgi:hypothetical protein
MFNTFTTTEKMGPRTFSALSLAVLSNPQPAPVPAVRTADQILAMREAEIVRPAERRVSEFLLKSYTVEKMAEKMFDLAIQLELATRAGKTDEAEKLDQKGKHYETIAEAKELIEPGFKVKVEEMVKARLATIVRGRKGGIHRMPTNVAHGMDGGAVEVGEQPEPLIDEDMRDAFSQVADPALVEALNALSMSTQQGGQSTL